MGSLFVRLIDWFINYLLIDLFVCLIDWLYKCHFHFLIFRQSKRISPALHHDTWLSTDLSTPQDRHTALRTCVGPVPDRPHHPDFTTRPDQQWRRTRILSRLWLRNNRKMRAILQARWTGRRIFAREEDYSTRMRKTMTGNGIFCGYFFLPWFLHPKIFLPHFCSGISALN